MEPFADSKLIYLVLQICLRASFQTPFHHVSHRYKSTIVLHTMTSMLALCKLLRLLSLGKCCYEERLIIWYTQIISFFTWENLLHALAIVLLRYTGYALRTLDLMTWNWSAASCYPSLQRETSGVYCEVNLVWPGQLMQNEQSQMSYADTFNELRQLRITHSKTRWHMESHAPFWKPFW